MSVLEQTLRDIFTARGRYFNAKTVAQLAELTSESETAVSNTLASMDGVKYRDSVFGRHYYTVQMYDTNPSYLS
jgi:hypothetical protein